MDIEALKELLNEYLVPAGTIDWMQYLLDALPYVVTIITVITTTIIQIRNSKRENERLLAQLEQQKELERIRHEEARKNAEHQSHLQANEKLRSERISAYSSLIDTLYAPYIMNDASRALRSAYAKSVKLLSLCTPEEKLFDAVDFVVKLVESYIISDNDITENSIQSIKESAQTIALYLNCPNFGRSDVSNNVLPEEQPR